MKRIFLMCLISFSLSQSVITTKDLKVQKYNDIKKINILELINEEGIFKVELLFADNLKYNRIKKLLVMPCELEFTISTGLTSNVIDFKVCSDKIKISQFVIVDKENPTIEINYDKFDYLEGTLILRISGEYKNVVNSSFNLDANRILREWYSNNQLYLEFNMKNGIKHGLCKKWYENGQLQIIYNYNKGELTGNQRKWSPNGQQLGDWNYSNDNLHGISKEWYSNGQIKSIKKYENGILLSVDASFDINGNPT